MDRTGWGDARRKGRAARIVPALIAAFMIMTGVALAAGTGLLNPGFEDGTGGSLDNWTISAHDYPDDGPRDLVYGAGLDPVPCDGTAYGVCVIEDEDNFDSYDFDTGETTSHTVSVLEGNRMVRLFGPFAHEGIAQSRDGLGISQTFNVDPAQPAIDLNYNIYSYDYAGFDEVGLRVKLSSEGSPTVVERINSGVGTGNELKTTGWRDTSLDLSAYSGQEVTLEIEMRGTSDTSYGTWAYIDAGTAPPPAVLGSSVTMTAPTAPGGKPVYVHHYPDSDSGLVDFVVSNASIDLFEERCMPANLEVPVQSGAGEVTEMTVGDGEDVYEGTETAPGKWSFVIDCLDDGFLSVSYIEDGTSLDANIGQVSLIDPTGIVYDKDAYDSAIGSGAGIEQALSDAAVSGATVELQRRDDGSFSKVAADSSDIEPGVNPESTQADGAFMWDVENGEYRVSVTKPGFEPATSSTFVEGETGLGVPLTRPAGPSVDPPVDPPVVDPPVIDPPVGTCGGLSGSKKIHCQRVAECKKLSGKKRGYCLKKANRRKKCLSLKGKKKSACEKKARALSKCDPKKGKKKKQCVARAKKIKLK